MYNIQNIADLKATIRELEFTQANELALVKEQYQKTCESFKLVNIIKSSFKAMVSAPAIKTNVVDAAIGLTTGFAAKKVMVGNTHNPFTKLLGFIVEIAVANKVAKNTEGIRSVGNSILKKIFNRNGST